MARWESFLSHFGIQDSTLVFRHAKTKYFECFTMTDVHNTIAATTAGEMEDSRASSDTGDEVKAWRPSNRMYVVFLTMCTITLAAALDATSLSVALPVCLHLPPPSLRCQQGTNTALDNVPKTSWHGNRSLLVRYLLPDNLNRLPTKLRLSLRHLRPSEPVPRSTHLLHRRRHSRSRSKQFHHNPRGPVDPRHRWRWDNLPHGDRSDRHRPAPRARQVLRLLIHDVGAGVRRWSPHRRRVRSGGVVEVDLLDQSSLLRPRVRVDSFVSEP